MCAGWAGGGVVQQESKVSIRCWPYPVYPAIQHSSICCRQGEGGWCPTPRMAAGAGAVVTPAAESRAVLLSVSWAAGPPHSALQLAVSTSCDNTVNN